ncbi:hypothetical protein [Alkalihalobacillus sp. 1P02AB]|uniref:hypothetical protein n=1 Tax=Alkalihalobacillus sp. 1P02AB TaxID=3132260 RepID=UPI0039A72670
MERKSSKYCTNCMVIDDNSYCEPCGNEKIEIVITVQNGRKNYTDPEFYSKMRSNYEIIDKIKVNTLPTLHEIKDFYEVHMFDDGYIGVYNTDWKRYVKPHIGGDRTYYFRYGLRNKDNRSKTVYMHRLVGLGWIDGWADGLVIDHKNIKLFSNPKDNQLFNLKENLEWVLPEVNTKRAVANGLSVGRPKVEKVIKPKLTLLERSEATRNGKRGLDYEQVDEVFKLFSSGYGVVKIAEIFNVSQPCISQIVNGKRWTTHPARERYMSIVC